MTEDTFIRREAGLKFANAFISRKMARTLELMTVTAATGKSNMYQQTRGQYRPGFTPHCVGFMIPQLSQARQQEE